MIYAKLVNNEVVRYKKPNDILCEDPALKGYKELVTRVGNGGTYETDTQIIVEIQIENETEY